MAAETTDKNRIRLDQLLVERGFFSSRARARDAILRGTVSVGGMPASKPGLMTPPNAVICVDDPAQKYVSRAALKLVHALDAFRLDPRGSHALDLGASTGGFTQVLLERGAIHVTAIDVGHGQIDAGLRADPRVTCIEGLNARDLTLTDSGGTAPDFITSDVSFISLRLALPPALALAGSGARGVFLVKPQFEAGREAIGKGGILRDRESGRQIAEEMATWLASNAGWRALGVEESPIEGGDGNREYLLMGAKAA